MTAAPIRAHRDADRPVVEVLPGVRARVRMGAADGAKGLTVVDQWLEPGASIPLHRHADGVEQSIWVVEGEARFVVGQESQVVAADHTVIVPPGTPHAIAAGDVAVRLLSRYSGDPAMAGDDLPPGASEAA